MSRFLFPKRRYRRSRRRFTPSFSISPEARKSIMIIVLVLIGVLPILAVAGLPGMIIEQGAEFIGNVVGSSLIIFFSFMTFLLSYILLHPDRLKVNAANYIGVAILIVTVSGLWHTGIPVEESLDAAARGEGGGYIGGYLAYYIIPYTGSILAIIIYIALFLLGIVLTFNTSLVTLTSAFHNFIVLPIFKALSFILKAITGRMRSKDEEDENVYDEGEEQEEEGEETDESEYEEEEAPSADSGEADSFNEDVEFKASAIGAGGSLLSHFTNRNGKKIPLSLLDDYTGKPTAGDVKEKQQTIRSTFGSFNIPVVMDEITIGPTITQFTLKPPKGVMLSKISRLSDDLALALAAHPIRIEAPIPGKSLVGIEVPNKAVAMVKLKTLLKDESYRKRQSNLMVALGKDVSGRSWLEDLGMMPHLLVAGATGSGKSVCLNTMIISLLYQNQPHELRFIMVDPKHVELSVYGKIPHLLTPVITDMPKVINALKWAINEMERRYEILAAVTKKSIGDYNKTHKEELMPYIIIVIDEIADLMSVSSNDVEAAIIRLAQKARAVGIHLILATQRPSVDVITGLIKANIPTRIAFAVAASSDSKTILDTSGADKLIGRGDMLFMSQKLSKPKRIQGVFIDDKEIGRVVNFLADNYEQDFDNSVTERQSVKSLVPGMRRSTANGGEAMDDEELVERAIEEVRQTQKASATFLQRRLSLGYARAARILDALEERGVVGPSEGSKPREVLIPPESDDSIEE